MEITSRCPECGERVSKVLRGLVRRMGLGEETRILQIQCDLCNCKFTRHIAIESRTDSHHMRPFLVARTVH